MPAAAPDCEDRTLECCKCGEHEEVPEGESDCWPFTCTPCLDRSNGVPVRREHPTVEIPVITNFDLVYSGGTK